MQAEKVSISLPKDMARMVREQAGKGSYASVSEVIREALRLWDTQRQERERQRASAPEPPQCKATKD